MRATIPLTVSSLICLAATSLAAQNVDELTRAQHWKRAQVAVEAGLRQSPGDAHLLMLQCRVLRAYGKLDDAVKAWERSIAADPKDWEPHWELGQVYADQIDKLSFFGRLSLAGKIKKEFESAVTANPNSFETHYAMM